MKTLEEIAREYGMSSYYMDMNTGDVYRFPDAIDDGEGNLLVPVTSSYGDGALISYAKMRKPE